MSFSFFFKLERKERVAETVNFIIQTRITRTRQDSPRVACDWPRCACSCRACRSGSAGCRTRSSRGPSRSRTHTRGRSCSLHTRGGGVSEGASWPWSMSFYAKDKLDPAIPCICPQIAHLNPYIFYTFAWVR